MEDIEFIEVTIIKKTHVYICDDCNKLIGKSEEQEDGYYAELGEIEYKFYVGDKWYVSRKTLCNQCKEKYKDKVIASLTSLGFIKKDLWKL